MNDLLKETGNITILKVTQNDLPDILDLQKLAYLSEAKLLNIYTAKYNFLSAL
jgi:hypothetical protein